MQYYRLWIYTCNVVLLLAVLFFVAVGSYVFSDTRVELITGVRFYHPTFLYAYVAIVLQGGVIQVVGCLGALRLNERLLNIYWLMLLSLLVGDVVFGVVWVFRFQNMITLLPGELSTRLTTDYSVDPEFTGIWDFVQKNERCCGVRSPEDFVMSAWSVHMNKVQSSDETFLLPSSCCRGSFIPVENFRSMAGSNNWLPSSLERVAPVTGAFRNRKWNRKSVFIQRSQNQLHLPTTTEPPPYNGSCLANDQPHTPFGRGCLQRLLQWYKSRADLLFIIGYCVITFLKVCFIGLLRCEIREMVQKMRILRAEMASNGIAGNTANLSLVSHGSGAGEPRVGTGLLAKVTSSTNVPQPRRTRQQQLMDEPCASSDSESNSHSRLLVRQQTADCPPLNSSLRPATGDAEIYANERSASEYRAASTINRVRQLREPKEMTTAAEMHELQELRSEPDLSHHRPMYQSQQTDI